MGSDSDGQCRSLMTSVSISNKFFNWEMTTKLFKGTSYKKEVLVGSFSKYCATSLTCLHLNCEGILPRNMRITDFNRPVIVNGMGYVKLFCNKQSPKVPRV